MDSVVATIVVDFLVAEAEEVKQNSTYCFDNYKIKMFKMFVYVQGDLVVVVAVTPIVKLVIVSTSPTKYGWDFAPSVLLLHICLFGMQSSAFKGYKFSLIV